MKAFESATRAAPQATLAALSLAAALVLGAADAAAAVDRAARQGGPQQGDWLIRGSLLSVKARVQEADIPAVGGRLTAPDKTLPGLGISYFATDHWGFEFQGGSFERDYGVEGSAIGSFAVGTISTDALSLTLHYHFRPAGPLKPYLGAGISRAWTRGVRPAPGIADFDVKPLTSPLISLGVDLLLAEHWMLNASARYLFTPAYHFEGDGFSAKVRIHTLVLGAGIGLYF